jgi:sugar-specific transcriptional regulator TrmB
MEDILESLDILPLNEKEKLVLVTLYQYGVASAAQVAIRSRIERTLAYKILKELSREHYVQEMKTNRGLVYKAREIENLVFEYERKLASLRRAGEQLKEAQSKKHGTTDVLVLEGKDGIREALYYGMENVQNEEILGVYSEVYQSEFIEVFNERHIFNRKHNINLKVIFPVDSPTAHDLAARAQEHGYSVECRFGSAKVREERKFFFNSSIEIIGNVFKVYSYENKRALIIADQQVVEAQRFIFHTLWSSSTPLG